MWQTVCLVLLQCKQVVKYSYECDGWDVERNRLVLKLAKEEFADKVVVFLELRNGI